MSTECLGVQREREREKAELLKLNIQETKPKKITKARKNKTAFFTTV